MYISDIIRGLKEILKPTQNDNDLNNKEEIGAMGWNKEIKNLTNLLFECTKLHHGDALKGCFKLSFLFVAYMYQ